MLIIQIEPLESGQHCLESQSHRTSCWMEGWIAVPPHLKTDVEECMGWCDLTIENGVLTSITPIERPPEPEPEPSDKEVLDTLLGVIE